MDNLDQYPQVLDYLMKERGFTRETINAYKVGAGTFRFLDDATQKWVDHQCVTFPWLQRVPKKEDDKKKGTKAKKEDAAKEVPPTTEPHEVDLFDDANDTSAATTAAPTTTMAETTATTTAATETEESKAVEASGEKDKATKNAKEEKKKPEDYDYLLVRMKYRPVVQKTFRLDPTGGLWGLFGMHLVPPDATEIILTVGTRCTDSDFPRRGNLTR